MWSTYKCLVNNIKFHPRHLHPTHTEQSPDPSYPFPPAFEEQEKKMK